MHAAAAEPTVTDLPDALTRLPLVTLYLSERCNSRCITCDYWRHGHGDMDLQSVARLLPGLERLRTELVLLSGGEPLLNVQWGAIAELLRAHGLKLWLLTSGLALAKHARRVAELFEIVTVSLDGTRPATYAAIRGLDAFDKVCEGIRAASAAGVRVSVRVTLQRANYRELPEFVGLAQRLGASQVSFLPVDVANPHAFGRQSAAVPDHALQDTDLPVLGDLLCALERDCAAQFSSGFIAESPHKLRRIAQYFAAVRGLAPFPPVRCNAPEFSAVIGAHGEVHPCFFISGPPQPPAWGGLDERLNAPGLRDLRRTIRAGARPECARCVCSMWREPEARSRAQLLSLGADTASAHRS